MREVCNLGLHERCFILAGVGPLASARTAKWIRENVPGVHVPDDLITRLEGANDERQEGVKMCIELIQQVKEIDGIAGVHVMAYRQEEVVAEIIQKSGVLNGRSPSVPSMLENL